MSRWKSSSTTGVWLSLVSSDFKKIDGPKCGNATRKGRLRDGVVPRLTSCNCETSCLAASVLASVCVLLCISGDLAGLVVEVSAGDSGASYGVTRKLPEIPGGAVKRNNGGWCNTKCDFEIGKSTASNESRSRPLSLQSGV